MTRLPFVLRSVLFTDLMEGLSFLLCVITKGDVICPGSLILMFSASPTSHLLLRGNPAQPSL